MTQRAIARKKSIETKLKKLDKVKKRHTRDKKRWRAEIRNARGANFHYAIQARNPVLEKRILDHLRQRHATFLSHSPGASTGFAPTKIFPVSMKAYWGLREEENASLVEGFPTAAYTGIPALATWLRDVTIPYRERHVISLLSRYRELLGNVQTWSDNGCERNKVRLSTEQVKAEVLDPICSQLLHNLQSYDLTLKKQIAACDPLTNKQNALKQCVQHCNERVMRWVLKDPDNANSILRMHPLTFSAIVKRHGGEFLSRSGGGKQKYHWMEDMIPANVKINEKWDKQIKALTANLTKEFPDMKKYIMDRSGSFSAIKAEVRDLVSEALIDISRTSAQGHPNLTERMAEKWEPSFRLPQKEKPGKGVIKRRHERLMKHSAKNGNKIYRESVTGMEGELKAHFETSPATLEAAWRRGIERLRAQTFHVLLNKVDLQKQVRGTLMKWTILIMI
ncbi:hypothetical protein MMYC01_205666 [Madurella mycetomatis]|uniref:Uncharacterized protein n=1 Tax=Madurella mycetomatis TaxID=100816 RepID=A0A175W4Z3_9PEZI|nr:hypothetical protein MMYC01_205666 [Madurella mycetomatis]